MLKRALIVFYLASALAPAETPTGAKGKQVVADAIAALGGDKFLDMQDRVESGRAYSFYRDRLSGLSIAKIYTRYITVDPTKSNHDLGVRERQAFGKNEDWALVLREDSGANITYRGPKELPMEDFERYREIRCTTSFTSCGSVYTKPAWSLNPARLGRGRSRSPSEIVDVIDAKTSW